MRWPLPPTPRPSVTAKLAWQRGAGAGAGRQLSSRQFSILGQAAFSVAGRRLQRLAARPIELGVVIHSGRCFCPSRTPQRNGNIKGRGTPLPFCADLFLHGLPGTALASVTLAVASRATDRAPAASAASRVSGVCARSIRPWALEGRIPLVAGSSRTTVRGYRLRQGARHAGPSLAPAPRNRLPGAAFGASSLPAHRVVTTRIAGAAFNKFSCLAAAGSREIGRLGCPTCGLAMRDVHQSG